MTTRPRAPLLPVRRRRSRPALAALVLPALLVACAGSGPTGSPPVATGSPTGAPTTGPAATSAGPTAAPSPTGLGLPLGDRLLATVPVDGGPCAMVASPDAVWVTSYRTGKVDRIDPATNAVTDRIDVGGSPCGIGLDASGRVWVAVLRAGAVVAVDPATGKVVGRIDGLGARLWDLKTGFGSVWVVDRDARVVLRIDPRTVKVVASIPVGPQAAGLAIIGGSVWEADDTDGKIRRIDPATNTVSSSVDSGGAATWFSDDGGANVLVSHRLTASVAILDPTTATPTTTIEGLVQPLDGTVVGGSAWIPDGRSQSIVVVDLAAGQIAARYALPGAVQPFVAEPGFGGLWVLDAGGTSVWRIRT